MRDHLECTEQLLVRPAATREIASPALHSVKDWRERRSFMALLLILLLAVTVAVGFTGPDGAGGAKHHH
jgi:hypothetical protein